MAETTDERAFEIFKVEQADENLLKIIGLTLKTLHVGDRLHIYDDKNALVSNAALFDVRRIFVFGRERSEIDRGFSIELFVSGNSADVLKDAKYLYLS
jgi:hypothetical protein